MKHGINFKVRIKRETLQSINLVAEETNFIFYVCVLWGGGVAERLYIPQDQLKEDANICMHDLANLDCQSPLWHYSTQPSKINMYGVNKIGIIYKN